MTVLGTLLALSRSEGTRVQPGLTRGRLLWAMSLLVGYALTLERLGFLPTTLLFTALWLRSIERSAWLEITLMTLASTAAIYAVFVRWLQIPLPAGVLGW